jgi:hypothetical protein
LLESIGSTIMCSLPTFKQRMNIFMGEFYYCSQ